MTDATTPEPSKIHGQATALAGAAKEKLGALVGNSTLEAKGLIEREAGNDEVEEAEAKKALASVGHAIGGGVKAVAGKLTGDKDLEVKGRAEQIQGTNDVNSFEPAKRI